MRRDHFTVIARHVDPDSASSPTLHVEYTGPTETLTRQLTDEQGACYPTEALDVAFRLQTPLDGDAVGVFSLTHRITGEYLLEVNVEAETVLDVVRAAREAGDENGRYHVHIHREGDEPIHHEMDALLCYDVEGDLLRQHSLIPSGVEL